MKDDFDEFEFLVFLNAPSSLDFLPVFIKEISIHKNIRIFIQKYSQKLNETNFGILFFKKYLNISLSKKELDFADDEIEITIVITMEEIFDGMPTFYFIMIVSSISAVVGALVGYRVIQQARIPKFVKKVRSVKKAIKSKSSAPSISIPTKNKMFMKELGKEWSDLGISLRDVLGIEEKKAPILSKAKELKKQKGGDK